MQQLKLNFDVCRYFNGPCGLIYRSFGGHICWYSVRKIWQESSSIEYDNLDNAIERKELVEISEQDAFFLIKESEL